MIRLSKTSITQAEKNAVMVVLDNEFLGMGKQVQQFEENLSDFFGRPAICVVNGTAALHLACQAIGLKVGDEVIVPSLTYVASFQAVSATGAKPVACDVDSKTLTFNWCDAEKRLTSKTKAIMPVHYAGGVGDLDGIYRFAKANRLRVIEDAAHAFGSHYNGVRVGGFGDIACFSFDGIKNITSGEGGCIVTEDESIINKVSDARLLGVENDTNRRNAGERSWEFDVTAQGWRYHMSNIMASIGIEQLKRFPHFIQKRQSLAHRYDQILAENEGITLIDHDYSNVVPHIYVVQIKGLINREPLREAMLDAGIQTGVHYNPNHMLSLYKQVDILPLTVTESIYPTLLTLPLQADMTNTDVDFVCTKLLSFIS